MALIERHPDLEDHFVELTLEEICGRGGIADLIEEGCVVIIANYRMKIEREIFNRLARSTDLCSDPLLRRKLKKIEAKHFFEGEAPVKRRGRLIFDTPLRQAVFDILCQGNKALFKHATAAVRRYHEEATEIFSLAFPRYDPFRLVSSLRLTRTLFENLHWDDHSIDDDFHQARVFANLDERPRIWHTSYRVTDFMREFYEHFDLKRFEGRDPNLMLRFLNGEVLGGLRDKWLDNLPRHRVAFDPGEVWLSESRLISHQIYYGEAALAYMWLVRTSSMSCPAARFNQQIEEVHRQMREHGAGSS